MVKAGAPVDAVIGELAPFLEEGDIIVDGGNSFFLDTERRAKESEAKSFDFVGMGVSGGEEGALWGPSLMPGGPAKAYEILEPMLTAIAAKTEHGACVTHMRSGRRRPLRQDGPQRHRVWRHAADRRDLRHHEAGARAWPTPRWPRSSARWNEGKLSSFLIEITAKVLRLHRPDTGEPLVEMILDAAEQKGTGRWTSQNALDLGTPIPVIDAAVFARSISSLKAKRVGASKMLTGPTPVDRSAPRTSNV